MNEWKKVRFLDVVHLNPRISLEKGVEYPFVEMSNVVPCARKPEKDVFKKYLGEGTKFEQGDTIVARIEPCLQNGKGFQCSYKQGFGSTEFLVFRPVNINDLDCDFLYYYMGQQSIREAMAKTMVGASGRQRVNNKVFNDLQINLPPLSTQHRIASILSRYDSLIENYQKQIKLLGEAAQRLYKEWFIDLHFPGHENTKIVDGVPEGWEKKSVDSIYNIKYGKNLSTKLITETGFYPVYGANGVIGYYDKANCNEQVVLITSRGNGSGDVLMTYHKDAFITNNSFIVTPSEGFEYCKLPFTFQFLKMANFRAVRTGAAQPQLTNQSIHTVDVLLPNKNLIEKFCSATIGMNDTIIKYREQIRLLTEARDRLLPKLMSGELTLEARAEKEDLLATPCKRGWEEDEAK